MGRLLSTRLEVLAKRKADSTLFDLELFWLTVSIRVVHCTPRDNERFHASRIAASRLA